MHTDGCTNEQGSASSSIIPSLDAKQPFRLSNRSSCTVAEHRAILSAIQLIRQTVTVKEWVIFSDSKAAFTFVRPMNCKRNNAGNVYKVLVEMTAAIQAGHELQWIPGHSDFTGNDARLTSSPNKHTLTDSTLPFRLETREMRCTTSFHEHTKQSVVYKVEP